VVSRVFRESQRGRQIAGKAVVCVFLSVSNRKRFCQLFFVSMAVKSFTMEKDHIDKQKLAFSVKPSF